MSLTEEIAAAAARLVVEEGLEYGPAKRRAARDLGRHATRRVDLPDNEAVEEQVRSYLALFQADTQPRELAALRAVAAEWMERLADFRPHVTGAVWRGTANRLSAVHLQLFCDDTKEAEIALINQRVPYDSDATTGPRGEEVPVLRLSAPSRALGEPVTVLLTVLDHDDLRGALRPDGRGQATMGDLAALRRRIAEAQA